MRKLLSFLLIFNLAHATAPTGYKNETATAKTYAQDLVFPNNQLTKQAGLDSRIETGNSNLLTNPSFEHSTPTTGWTITNATATADTTNQVEGKKALSLALTGALSVVQDSTINAANLVGLQGVARVKIKTSDVDGLKVCTRNAGVTSTSLCINIPKDGAWKEINIPYILTATSNGIAITSTGTTGTVKLDDAFVGTSAPFQGVSGAKLVGTVTISGCSGAWSTSSTSFASFSTLTGCTYTTSGQAQAPSTNIPAIKFASLPAGDYRLEYEGGLGLNAASTSTTAYFQFTDGTNTAREISNYYAYNSQPISSTMSQTITYNSSQSNVTLEIKGKISGTVASAITGTTSQPGTIKVWYFPPESKIYSQASQDVAYQPCTFSTLAWQGLGTVTNNLLCARKGQNLLIKGRVTLGTVAAAQAQIPLPTNFGTITTASNIPSTSYASGFVLREASSANTIYSLIQLPSVSYLAMAGQLGNTTINPNSPLNGSAMFSNSDILSIPEIAIPIQGWQDYGVIVGSFAGIETCSSPYECTDTFSAQVSSTGVVSNENIDWINGNCTNPSTGNYTCTYNTILKDGISALSSPMSCNVTSTAASARTPFGYVNINSTTSVSPQIVDDNGATTNSGFFISCQKGANDYKPKTAKVATSIGVPTVPGITTTGTGNLIDTFSVSYGTTNATTVCSASPCSYLDQIGTAVSSITRSGTGAYSLNTSKTYVKLKCMLNAPNGATYGIYGVSSGGSCSNCSTLAFESRNTSSINQDTYGTLFCQGSY